MLNSNEISNVLPHRFPLLMIDRIIEIEEGKSATGIKNITITDPVFLGHFPENHIYPGVLLVESMAQVGAFAIMNIEKYKDKYAYFMGIKEAKFRKPVIPGDSLIIKTEITNIRHSFIFAKSEITRDEELVAEAEMTFAVES